MNRPGEHPKTTEPLLLAATILFSIVGAVIGMQILTTLGITPNTSIIGVLLAMLVGRLPMRLCRSLRSIHRQNLLQTSISSATFGAANSLLMPIGIPFLMGRPDLILPMLCGAAMGMLIDLGMLYWLFDSRLFPGSGIWPSGIAAAETILAGDRGGRRRQNLIVGAAAGVMGSSGLFRLMTPALGPAGIPMAAFGVAFIGNIAALSMFALGLLLRAYAPAWLNVDLNRQFIPHGIMLGAGLVALLQAIATVMRPKPKATQGAGSGSPESRSTKNTRNALIGGFGLYLAAGVILAIVTGIWSEMTVGQLLLWIVYAAIACIAAELIVGFSAMHTGWFPAFATALLFMIVGMLLGFPATATAVLVGFVAAGGPAFADAGYDLKAGWYLRGMGHHLSFEMQGRRQQLLAAFIGLLTALVMVALFHDVYFQRDLIPPVSRVYVTSIESGLQPSIASSLLLWAVPGALLQLAGGAGRQLGVLFGTGLLILNPIAGWAVLVGLAIRIAVTRIYGRGVEPSLVVFAAGCIAGDALWSFGDSILRLR